MGKKTKSKNNRIKSRGARRRKIVYHYRSVEIELILKMFFLSRLKHKNYPQTAFGVAEREPINLYYILMVNDEIIPVKDSKYGSNFRADRNIVNLGW